MPTKKDESPEKKKFNLYMEKEVGEAVKRNLDEDESFSGLVNHMLKRRLQGFDDESSMMLTYGENLVEIGRLLISKGEDLKEKARE